MSTKIIQAADWNSSAEEIAAKALEGEILIFPTETVYGVGTCATAFGAEKLSKIKGRPQGKPFQALISSFDMIESLGARPGPRAKLLMEKFWPGGMTLVMPIDPSKVPIEIAPHGTVGFRMPDHEMCLDLVRRLGGIMLATSANFSGGPEAATCMEAVRYFQGGIYAAVDAGPSRGTKPSTVVSVRDDIVTVLREGAIPAADIMRAAGCEKAS